MRKLLVSIEIDGKEHVVGRIEGSNPDDACFQYDLEYLNSVGKPISIALPIQEEYFSAEKTRSYFEGLMPEGFSRRAVATWMHADENDYLTILAKLGQECIGALRVTEDVEKDDVADYKMLTPQQMKALAAEGAVKSTEILMESHLSLAGASGKVGLFYDEKTKSWYQPIGDAPSTHIIKQSHVRLEKIVVNELLCLKTASNMGIETAESFIIDTGEGKEEDVLFATRRYDRMVNSSRIISGHTVPFRLHQEDFAQAMGIPASEKYEKKSDGYLKKMFQYIRLYAHDPIKDQLKLWDRVIYNYLVGNTDGHIKNYSFLYDKDLEQISLAPAYDIVSTRIYGLISEMSFFIGGTNKISDINRETFRDAAKEIGLGEKLALSRLDYLKEIFEKNLKDATEEFMDYGLVDAKSIEERILKSMRW